MIINELLYYLTKKEILKRYKQSVLGFMWFLIKPTIMISLLYFAYYKVGSLKHDIYSGVLIVITGYLPWFLISQIILQTSNSLIKNKNLIEKTDTSRNIIMLSGSLYSIFEFLIFFVITSFILNILFKIQLFNILLYLIFSIFLIIFSYSIASIIAVINVWYRDTAQIVLYSVNLLAFVLPVGFLTSNVENFSFFYSYYNPLIFSIELSRQLLIGDVTFNYSILLSNFLLISSFCIFSYFTIQKKLKELADII